MFILVTNEKQTENILKCNIYNTNELHKEATDKPYNSKVFIITGLCISLLSIT